MPLPAAAPLASGRGPAPPPAPGGGARGERLGLLGGTFDPPHCGHVAAARACVKALDLARLLLVVANEPWQKTPQRSVTAATDRLAMAAEVAAMVPHAEASAIEVDRGGPSYTADTVDEILAGAVALGAPPPEIFLIVGSDLVRSLSTWKRVDDLRRKVTLAVVSRPGNRVADAPPGWRTVFVEGEAVDVSSSEVRDRLERGLPVGGLVPDEVVRCIGRRGLYAVGR